MTDVQGNCPMGCGEGLILAEDGVLWCANLLCPQPDAAARILADDEAGHVITFAARGFAIRHPLRERLDGALEDCRMHQHCEWLAEDGSAPLPGTYRVRGRAPGIWEQLP